MGDDTKSGAFEVIVQAVPDDDVFLGEAGVLKTLADELNEEHVCGNAAASEAVDFQSNHFAGAGHSLPGFQGRIGGKEGLHRTIEHVQEAGRIRTGA